jgi:hypothetical protein
MMEVRRTARPAIACGAVAKLAELPGAKRRELVRCCDGSRASL